MTTRSVRPTRGVRASRGRGPLAASLAVLTILVSASCAAASPGSVPGPADGDGDGDGPLDRAFIYEVGPEQARALAAADTVSTVQVSGSAEVEVEPDRARVLFAVESRDETAQGASRRNAEEMDAVLGALRETEMPGLELETRGYSLRPEYRRPDSGDTPELDGFRASNTVEATISDPESVGALIDAAIGAGANRVTALSFLVSDSEEARLEALRGAVEAARRDAEAIAGALGMTLGEALEVTGGADNPGSPISVRMEALGSQGGPTPVEPGSQTIRASVTIRYALREASR